jgi:long-chain acyl-CoA synthetase
MGDGQPHVTALITVNTGIAESLGGPEAVAREVQDAVARVNRHLAPFEQVRRFRILERDFSIESGELTATLKVRRARVLENFREAVAELYR